ncbi:MAG: DMT family transporter [Methylocystis sp.]|nr:DMT family transporter [Methylocystis sp.]
MTRIRADLLLLLTATIWGTAFITQKNANNSMGPVSFVGARFLLSWLTVAPLALYEHKRNPAQLQRRDFVLAGIIGVLLFIGAALQQIGLVTTTATNAGFLTALYVILVPFVVWAMHGARPRPMVLVACVLSIAGAWLLTRGDELRQLAFGDALILVSDVIWAVWICLVPLFMRRADRPFFLAFTQFGVTAVLGLAVGIGFESVSVGGVVTATPFIVYAGVLSGGLAYTLQILAQKHTPPTEAAVIMSLESVFAALAGALLLSERLTGPAVVGCALILLGVILVEIGPARAQSGPE